MRRFEPKHLFMHFEFVNADEIARGRAQQTDSQSRSVASLVRLRSLKNAREKLPDAQRQIEGCDIAGEIEQQA